MRRSNFLEYFYGSYHLDFSKLFGISKPPYEGWVVITNLNFSPTVIKTHFERLIWNATPFRQQVMTKRDKVHDETGICTF